MKTFYLQTIVCSVYKNGQKVISEREVLEEKIRDDIKPGTKIFKVEANSWREARDKVF